MKEYQLQAEKEKKHVVQQKNLIIHSPNPPLPPKVCLQSCDVCIVNKMQYDSASSPCFLTQCHSTVISTITVTVLYTLEVLSLTQRAKHPLSTTTVSLNRQREREEGWGGDGGGGGGGEEGRDNTSLHKEAQSPFFYKSDPDDKHSNTQYFKQEYK